MVYSKTEIGFTGEKTNNFQQEKIKALYDKANSFAHTDPEVSLFQAKRVVDMICAHVYEDEMEAKSPKQPIHAFVEWLVEQELINRALAIHFTMIELLTKDIDSIETIDNEYLQSCLNSLQVVFDWYIGKESKEKVTVPQTLPKNISPRIQQIKEKDSLGTSQFASIDEMDGYTGDDGLIIGETLRLNEQKSFEHCVCVGPTGSGKTASFFIPNLMSLPNASIVVSDPKGELFEKTAAANLTQGKRLLVFNPFQKNTMCYNPLALCRSVSEVRELAQMLLVNGNAAVEIMTGVKGGGSEWLNMSTPLLTAFLLYVQDLRPPKNTVSYALSLITENDIDTLKILMNDAGETAEKQFNIFLQSSESEKTASSIRTVLATSLQIFTDPLIEDVTSVNEINPLMLREKPTVLYIMVPHHKSATMSPVMAPFYRQLMNHLVESEPTFPVYFLLDEFANIGIIPNIDSALATFRYNKISISLGIQSLTQLKQRYGEETALTILDNVKTKFVLPGLSYDSAQYFSNIFGFTEISYRNHSFDQHETKLSFNINKQRRELLSADEIRRLDDETLIAVVDNRNPYKDKQLRYYLNSKLEKLSRDEIDLDKYIAYVRGEKQPRKREKKRIGARLFG